MPLRAIAPFDTTVLSKYVDAVPATVTAASCVLAPTVFAIVTGLFAAVVFKVPAPSIVPVIIVAAAVELTFIVWPLLIANPPAVAVALPLNVIFPVTLAAAIPVVKVVRPVPVVRVPVFTASENVTFEAPVAVIAASGVVAPTVFTKVTALFAAVMFKVPAPSIVPVIVAAAPVELIFIVWPLLIANPPAVAVALPLNVIFPVTLAAAIPVVKVVRPVPVVRVPVFTASENVTFEAPVAVTAARGVLAPTVP